MQLMNNQIVIRQSNLEVGAVLCAADYFYAYWFSQGLA